MTSPAAIAPEAEASAGVGFAGIALQAADTGRVLLLQRSLADLEDPNAGLWEFPGGALDEGEDPYEGALREFAEEVGVPVPEDAENGGTSWDLPPDAPKYRLHLLTVPTESSIDMNSNAVQNPDDPNGLNRESLAFWDPDHIEGGHIRPEVLDAMEVVGENLTASGDAVAEKIVGDDPKTPPSPDDEVDSAEQVVDLLEQITTALADPEHNPAAVAELAKAARDILDPGVDVMPEDAITASAAPVAPPDEWFEPFDLDGPTPLTITADGRVFGHVATWDSCHRGGQYAGKCVPPPKDPNAPFFHLGSVITASGQSVDVGGITVGGGHFTASGVLTTLEHHDDVTSVAAAVRTNEDKWGIAVYGSVTPEATPTMVAALRRSPVSGAWRTEKGRRRLVGIHAVVDPGFPIPRSMVASVTPEAFVTFGRVEGKTPDPNSVDLRAAARIIARAARLDMESLVASVRNSMADLDCGCDDEPLVASLVGDMDLPVAGYNLDWNGGEAADRVFDFYTKDGVVDVDSVAKAFLWRNTDHPADQKQGYDLPFADIIDGKLQIVPKGVQAAASGHGVSQLAASSEDKNAIKARLGTLYGRVQGVHPDAPANPFSEGG